MVNTIYRSANIQAGSGRFIEGYAIVFNSLSNVIYEKGKGLYREIIRPSAITEDLIRSSDIIANMSHDNLYMQARLRHGEGNIELKIDNHGLHFRFACLPTEKGEELLTHVRMGNITQCSFGYRLDVNDKSVEKWHLGDDGIAVREILKIQELCDISCVISPAFEDTECNIRDLEHCKKQIEACLNEQKDLEQSRINKKYDFYLDYLDELDK